MVYGTAVPACRGTPLALSTCIHVSEKGTAPSLEKPYIILHHEPEGGAGTALSCMSRLKHLGTCVQLCLMPCSMLVLAISKLLLKVLDSVATRSLSCLGTWKCNSF